MSVQFDQPAPLPAPVLTYASSGPPRSLKPRVWPAYVFALLILLYPIGLGLVVGFAGAIIGIAMGHSISEIQDAFKNAWLLLGFMFLMAVINMLLVAGFQWLSRRLKPRLPVLRRPRTGWISMGVLALGAVAIAQIFSAIMSALEARSASLETISHIMAQMRAAPVQAFHVPLVPLLVISFVGPIGEEVVFRGAIQSRLVRRHGAWLGILLTSVFFGIYHWDFTQGLFAFVIGLYLGFVAYRTRSILPAILCHMAINVTSTVFYFSRFHIIGNSWGVLPTVLLAAMTAVSVLWLVRVPFLRAPATSPQ